MIYSPTDQNLAGRHVAEVKELIESIIADVAVGGDVVCDTCDVDRAGSFRVDLSYHRGVRCEKKTY